MTGDPTTPAHLAALQKANTVRFGHAALKREVRAGLPFVDAITDERAVRMRIGALLSAVPGWGEASTRRVLGELQIGEHRRVEDIDVPRLCALVARVEAPGPTASTAVKRRRPPRLLRPTQPPSPSAPTAVSAPEPNRQDARVLAALVRGPATRAELSLRLSGMRLQVDDIDAALARLQVRGAVVVIESNGFRLYSVGAEEDAA